MSRDRIVDFLDHVYEVRQRGEYAHMAHTLAPGATFRIAADPSSLSIPVGPAAASDAVPQMVERFTFHSIEQLGLLVDGNRAAAHLRVVVSTGGGEPVTTELLDLWEFDESGKVRSLVEFVDTAMMRLLC